MTPAKINAARHPCHQHTVNEIAQALGFVASVFRALAKPANGSDQLSSVG